jgi:hypothetical protein
MPPTEALRLSSPRGRGRTALLVLFVLLTVAAVVVGVFVLRSLGGSQGQRSTTPQGAVSMLGPASDPSAAGTVALRAPVIDTGGGR